MDTGQSTNSTYRFYVKEVFVRYWIFALTYVILSWLWFWGRSTKGFMVALFSWQAFILPCAIFIFSLVFWFRIRRLSYEVSSTTIVKRCGERVLRSVDLSKVEGIDVRLPMRLKIANEDIFLFEGIVIKSTRERLRSLFGELGIGEIKVKWEMFSVKQIATIIGGCLCVTHFAVSVLLWVFGASFLFKYRGVGMDWVMLVHAVPAFLLLSTSILALVLALKRRRRAGLVLLLTIVAAIGCCVFEISNGFYQGVPVEYCTWWWFKPAKSDISIGRDSVYYKYGYINKSGEMVISPQFDSANEFSEGLAVIGFRIENDKANENATPFLMLPGMMDIEKDGYFDAYKYGYIDTAGKVVIESKYDYAENFSEGLAVIGVNDNSEEKPGREMAGSFQFSMLMNFPRRKYGYIDDTGTIVIEPKYDYAENFSDGLARVTIDGERGYINKKGELIVDLKFYHRVSDLSEGFAAVEIDDKSGYIDKTGQIVIEPKFDSAGSFSEGLAAVRINGKWGYIDNAGQVVIDAGFDYASGFSDGLAVVWFNRRWGYVQECGYIDKRGQMVIEPKVCWAYPFFEGLAIVSYEHGWGYREKFRSENIDKTGKAVNKPYFDRPLRYSEGLAEVEVDDKYGYVDKNGSVVIEARFDVTDRFSEGFASVGMEVPKAEDQ